MPGYSEWRGFCRGERFTLRHAIYVVYACIVLSSGGDTVDLKDRICVKGAKSFGRTMHK